MMKKENLNEIGIFAFHTVSNADGTFVSRRIVDHMCQFEQTVKCEKRQGYCNLEFAQTGCNFNIVALISDYSKQSCDF